PAPFVGRWSAARRARRRPGDRTLFLVTVDRGLGGNVEQLVAPAEAPTRYELRARWPMPIGEGNGFVRPIDPSGATTATVSQILDGPDPQVFLAHDDGSSFLVVRGTTEGPPVDPSDGSAPSAPLVDLGARSPVLGRDVTVETRVVLLAEPSRRPSAPDRFGLRDTRLLVEDAVPDRPPTALAFRRGLGRPEIQPLNARRVAIEEVRFSREEMP
ncbi:MAG TPA: hypothetical protein RMF84_17830, partial [Polyangiaceae bacterium LLY-WYZ-14_1]|nr:hypothetical protein [Polyangiaceae bacterium LLY-WYZ-14_1]